MQLDAVRRDAGLAVQEVEETDTGDLYRNVRSLEARRRRILRIELRARSVDVSGERAARAYASRVGNFRDHRVAGSSPDDQVIIRVGFELVLSKRRIDHEH